MRIPSEDLQKRIADTIKYRFYDRLDLYDVYRWLDNFQDDELEMAVSVLEKLEYYREEDLLGILSSKLDTIFKDVWREFQKPFRVLFMPLGRPGKSGHIIQYLVKNLFKYHTPKHVKEIVYNNHPKDIDIQSLTEEDVIIFLDDIIGSGDSFATDCKLTFEKEKRNGEIEHIKNEWTIGNVVKENAPYKIVLLSCILMDKGKAKIERDFPYLKLYGDVRAHAFSKSMSPFGGYYKMKQIREFCYKYGRQICHGRELGYSNSQALALFAHAVPNNTLPIIWVDKYEDNGTIKYWQPLIARDQLKKQNMAFIQRMDNNRWVFKLSQFFGMDLGDPDWKGIIQDKNVRLIYLLRCLDKNIPEVVIANDMGLTNDDMVSLFEEGEEIGLWDKTHEVTHEAQKALAEATKIFRIENKDKGFVSVDDRDYMYIPETFRGRL